MKQQYIHNGCSKNKYCNDSGVGTVSILVTYLGIGMSAVRIVHTGT